MSSNVYCICPKTAITKRLFFFGKFQMTCVLSFGWFPWRLNFMCRCFGTLCLLHFAWSIFIGGVSRKNNRDEISRVMIQVKVWLKNTLHISSRLFLLLTPPMKMEQAECSETSAYKFQTPGNYSEESIQHSEHGGSWDSNDMSVIQRHRMSETKALKYS